MLYKRHLLSSLVILTCFISVSQSGKVVSICDHGQTTPWNRMLPGAHVRYWLSSVTLKGKKPPKKFLVNLKHNVKSPKDYEPHTRLDFIAPSHPKTEEIIGKAWKNFGYTGQKYHDGYLYGKLDSNREMTGDMIAFVYPDFETVLLGQFKNGTMIAAKPSKIVAERCKNGIKELKFARPKKNAPILKYQRPTFLRIGDQPQVMDPFEKKNIFISNGVKDDGIFAKRDIRMGELICYYSGTIFDPKIHPSLHQNMTSEERYAAHKYIIRLRGKSKDGSELQMNIPREFWDISKFRATLGHKFNHSFVKFKAQFNWATHPRYGPIRSVTAIEDIYKGEEIFIHYHYPIKAGAHVPAWYKEQYEEEIGPWPKVAEKGSKK